MDMSEGVWPPVVPEMTNIPLDNPNCINESCTVWYAAANASQEVLPFDVLNIYGHWTTWFYLSVIGTFTIMYILTTWYDHRSLAAMNKKSMEPSALQKIQAFGRLFTYRQTSYGPLKKLQLPLNGMLTLLVSGVLFTVLITFAVRPYYRAHYGYGSPPLAIRSGFAAFACIPLLIALAGKANVITLLTGISHEKLNVLHRWVAWVSFGLAWVHTIPFFWISYTDGGAANVAMQFYMGDTGRTEWGGVPPLMILFLLCVISLEPIRSQFYETFYQLHILLAISYFGLLYWHAGNVLDSWTYLWATMALWLSSWLARAFWYTQPLNIHHSWFEASPATITTKPGNMTEIQIVAPLDFKFSPTQHCFLRIPRLALLGNHPFTICSSYLEPTASQKEGGIHPQTLVFMVRTHGGFTKRLVDYVRSHPDNQLTIWIEGPYGGVSRHIELAYDNLVLIAGGGGITACLPWLSFLAQKVKAGALNEFRTRRVCLLWTVKENSHFTWASPILQKDLAILSASLNVQMSFHITSEADEDTDYPKSHERISNPGKVDDSEGIGNSLGRQSTIKEIASQASQYPSMDALGSVAYCRRDLREYVEHLSLGGRSFVIGCGPEGLRGDLANAIAERQRDVLNNKAQEIALHLEAFD